MSISKDKKIATMSRFSETKKSIKLVYITPQNEFLSEENPTIKLNKSKKNIQTYDTTITMRKDDKLIEIKDEPIKEMRDKDELFKKSNDNYLEKRKLKFIKINNKKYTFKKTEKSSSLNLLNSLQNIQIKKYIPIAKLVESEINFSKKKIFFGKKIERSVTKSELLSTELLNHKCITKNVSYDEDLNVYDYEFIKNTNKKKNNRICESNLRIDID